MKHYFSLLLLSTLILGFILSVIMGAGENLLVTEASSEIKINQSINQSDNQSVNEFSSKEKSNLINVTRNTEGVHIAERKFRVLPDVFLRPVNDIITSKEDGLVELYIDNPSLNDVTLNVDARISVPSGIHVYGEGFGQAGGAGTVYGTFSVPPGTARTIYINIKGEKLGNFTVNFFGYYWLEDDKDNYNKLSLNHSFTIKEPSVNYEKTLILVLVTIISIVVMIVSLMVLKDAN